MEKYYFKSTPTGQLLSDLERSSLDIQFLTDQRDSCKPGSAAQAHYAVQAEKERALYDAIRSELIARRVIQ